MSGYRLVTYLENARPKAGLLCGERIVGLDAILSPTSEAGPTTVLSVLEAWETMRPLLSAAAARLAPDAGIAVAQAELLAPILYPAAIFCSRGNYFDHLLEMAKIGGRPAPQNARETKEPYYVLKTSAHSVIGPNAAIPVPAFSAKLDWEAEIGVVIGKPTRNVSEDEAPASVAGYVIVNDVSARDVMTRERDGMKHLYDWFEQKCFEGSAPMGPWLTPAEFVPDPYDLSIKLWLNDELKQNGHSSNMVYSIAEQIAYLSRHVTLRPGDVILTGCPSGVGMSTGRFLKPGDRIRIEVSHCGTLENWVAA